MIVVDVSDEMMLVVYLIVTKETLVEFTKV